MNRLQTRAITLALVGVGAAGTAATALAPSPSESVTASEAAGPLVLVGQDGSDDSARNQRHVGEALRTTEARQRAAAARRAAVLAAAARRASTGRVATARASRGTTRQPIRHPIATGDPRAIARTMLPGFGWSPQQFGCLDPLWTRESGWRVSAANSSGAYGIPQALPGSKMAMYGADWRTNPRTQIAWGMHYIAGRYGSPCSAWAHFEATGWY